MTETRIEFLTRRAKQLEEAHLAKRKEWDEAASRHAMALIRLGLRQKELTKAQVDAELTQINADEEADKPHIAQLGTDVNHAWEEWMDAVERLERALAQQDDANEVRS